MAKKTPGTEKSVTVKRSSKESEVSVKADLSKSRGDLKKGIKTPLQFFNHMLETIAWRSCINIGVSLKLSDYRLTHVICEDTGIVLGEALRELLGKEMKKGVNGSGCAYACIDEALARCAVSFEDRAQIHVSENLTSGPELVEDMQAADLVGFLEGVSQGSRATLHVDLVRGVNPHHVWESVFRAFGEALREAFAPCPFRKGTTPGVKGVVRMEKE
ncbi:MAG: hypothetical protein ABIH66_06270 [bacterium]